MAKYEKGSFTVVVNMKEMDMLPSLAQLIFLWLCHYANQDGTCFPSITTIAKRAKISRRSVMRYTETLIEAGFIEKVVRKKNQSKENDSNFYSIVIGVNKKTNTKKNVGNDMESLRDDSRSLPVVSGSHSNYIYTTKHNNYISDSKESRPVNVDKKEYKHSIPDKKVLNNKWKAVRPELIDLFGNVDSVNVKNWYGNVTQLKALDQLLDSEGEATVRRAIELLPEVLQEEFCPRVYTPYELLKKWPKLKQYLISRKTRKEPTKTTTASMAEDLID